MRKVDRLVNDGVFAYPYFGYFVFTIPEELREAYKSIKNIHLINDYVRRKIKREFSGKPFISVWHWTGDKDQNKFHPHLNIILLSITHISGEKLNQLKDYG